MTENPLKAWREAFGLTQAQAAERLGINRRTVIRAEEGDRLTPKLAKLIGSDAPARTPRPVTAVPVTIEPELPPVVTVEPARSVPAVRAQLAEREPLRAKHEERGWPLGFHPVTGDPIYSREAGHSKHATIRKKGASE